MTLHARALRALAMREHSRSELRRKLLRHLGDDDDPAVVDALLDRLERDGHLSEQRFAESRVRLRAARLGAARIAAELKQHGVSLPADAAAALRASEIDRARALWQRRFGTLPASPEDHARQARFLIGRGFAAEAVRRVLRQRADNEG